MAEQTKIQWSDSTFNCWRGCTKVSPGCKFCYAERGSLRNQKTLGVWGPQGTRVLASDAMWREPLKWERDAGRRLGRHLVFCASLADVFEEWDGQMTDSQERRLSLVRGAPLPDSQAVAADPDYTLDHARARLWELIRATPHLTWQLLTKRPENIGKMMPHGAWPNVWLGTSVETQEWAWRLDALAEAPQEVPVRFVSAEPLLGPLSLWSSLAGGAIQWVIVGGESGGQARPLWLSWVRTLIDDCAAWEVPCFVKQLGKVAMVNHRLTLRLVSDPGHGGEPEDWPDDLRVREMPDV